MTKIGNCKTHAEVQTGQTFLVWTWQVDGRGLPFAAYLMRAGEGEETYTQIEKENLTEQETKAIEALTEEWLAKY
jgi:hypothetical protein